MLTLLNLMINSRDKYKKSKRFGRMDDFYQTIGDNFEVQGNVVDNFLRNIARDYREVLRNLKTSGIAGEIPKLRGSYEIFRVFEEYYQVYYPAGGAARPQFVMTEHGYHVPGPSQTAISQDSRPKEHTYTPNYESQMQRSSQPSTSTFDPKPRTNLQSHEAPPVPWLQLATALTPPTTNQGVFNTTMSTNTEVFPHVVTEVIELEEAEETYPEARSVARSPPPAKRAKSSRFLDESTEIQRQHLELQRQQTAYLCAMSEEMKYFRQAYFTINGLKLDSSKEDD